MDHTCTSSASLHSSDMDPRRKERRRRRLNKWSKERVPPPYCTTITQAIKLSSNLEWPRNDIRWTQTLDYWQWRKVKRKKETKEEDRNRLVGFSSSIIMVIHGAIENIRITHLLLMICCIYFRLVQLWPIFLFFLLLVSTTIIRRLSKLRKENRNSIDRRDSSHLLFLFCLFSSREPSPRHSQKIAMIIS